MAIVTDLIMAVFMSQSNKTARVEEKKTSKWLAGAQCGPSAPANECLIFEWAGRESVKAVWHTDTPPPETSAMQREEFFFFLTHHKTTHSLGHGTQVVQTRSLCLSPLPSAFLVFAAVFGGLCSSSSSATAGSRQFARLERRRSRHALRPALCRHHHCRGGGS